MSAISEAGEMCGGRNCAGGSAGGPIAWYGAPPIIELQQYMPAGKTGRTESINSWRQIVGTLWNIEGGGATRAFLYQNQTTIDLGTLPGHDKAECYAINDKGLACGFSGLASEAAVVWDYPNVTSINLPLGPNSVANDISGNNLVCGWMGQFISSTATSHAFIYDLSTGQTTDIGTPLPGTINAQATGVNTLGSVCGRSAVSCGQGCVDHLGFFWNKDAAVDLGELPDYPRCSPQDINDANVVVGFCSKPTGVSRAFVWQDGVIYPLSDVVPQELNLVISSASGINNAGQIAADGWINGGPNVALRLNPIPPQPGDCTCDWLVDSADLLAVIAGWGDCPPEFTAPCTTDFNNDNRTGVPDLLHVINHWGQGQGMP